MLYCLSYKDHCSVSPESHAYQAAFAITSLQDSNNQLPPSAIQMDDVAVQLWR